MFRKKYIAMPDGSGKTKKNYSFLPSSFKKKSKGLEVVAESANEDILTVALSHLSSNPPSPARTSDSTGSSDDPPLWNSTFSEEEDEEEKTNVSSDMLLIFTSASGDTEDPPIQVLAGEALSLSSISDNGSPFRAPPRKTAMPTSLATVPVNEQESKPVTPAPKKKEHKPEPVPPAPKDHRKSIPIDMDTNDEWHDDEDCWVEFVDERKDHADWGWSVTDSIDWSPKAPMDEVAELPFSDSFEYLPKDTSDEASLDPSTVSAPVSTVSVTPSSPKTRRNQIMMVRETRSGQLEVCDPECPLRFFIENEQEQDYDEEPPEDTPGYPFLGDVQDEDPQQRQQGDMFSLSFYQHKISTFKSVESRQHMTQRLHRETVALIGSVSEKLSTWDEEARSRFRSTNTPQEEDVVDAVSIATSSSEETRKKRNTSYFTTETFDYNMFGKCNMIDPFLRFGQAEV